MSIAPDDALLRRLLGDPGPELTCEACFEHLDRYVELELAISRCLGIDLAPPCPPSVSETRTRIRDYGLAVRRDSEARLASARDELCSITELLRLILARSELSKVDLLTETPVADTVALLEE